MSGQISKSPKMSKIQLHVRTQTLNCLQYVGCDARCPVHSGSTQGFLLRKMAAVQLSLDYRKFNLISHSAHILSNNVEVSRIGSSLSFKIILTCCLLNVVLVKLCEKCNLRAFHWCASGGRTQTSGYQFTAAAASC